MQNYNYNSKKKRLSYKICIYKCCSLNRENISGRSIRELNMEMVEFELELKINKLKILINFSGLGGERTVWSKGQHYCFGWRIASTSYLLELSIATEQPDALLDFCKALFLMLMAHWTLGLLRHCTFMHLCFYELMVVVTGVTLFCS